MSDSPNVQTESLQRQEQILDAAQALIAENGLEGFRIREVAQRAQIHHASMLYYFPNREALIRGVVQRIVADLDRVPAPGTAAYALQPRQALHEHLRHVLGQLHSHPDRFIVLNELFVRATRDQEVRNVLAEIDVSWRGYLVPLLTSGLQEGVFRSDLEPETAALMITSFFKGLTMQLNVTYEQMYDAIKQLEHWIAGGNSLL